MNKDRRHTLRLANADIKTFRHTQNPFMENWAPETVVKNRKVDLADKNCKDGEGKPLIGKLLIEQEKDAGRFIKVSWDFLDGYKHLSSTARAVLDFVMYQTLPGNAIVWAPAAEALVFCQFKQPKSFYDGISELILYEYLARTEKQGYYFINPRRYFNGGRVRMNNTFRKPKNTYSPPQS